MTSGRLLRVDGSIRRGQFRIEIELTIAAGETVALVGPNGAGKSTILEAIAGLVALDRGFVEFGGVVFDRPEGGAFMPPDERHVGLVFQRYHLFDHLTVFENVAFGPRVRGRGASEVDRHVGRLLERLGLTTLADRRPNQLSGGQAQRVAIARALASGPELLLLDEPLAALDPESKADLRRILAETLQSHGGPSLIVTHDLNDALLLADRIGVVEAGHLTQIGTIEELRADPATGYVASFVQI